MRKREAEESERGGIERREEGGRERKREGIVRNTGKSVDEVVGAIGFIKGHTASERLETAFRAIPKVKKRQ